MTDPLVEIQARLCAQDRAIRRPQPALLRCDALVDAVYGEVLSHYDVEPVLRLVADYLEGLDASQRLYAHETIRRTLKDGV
jgi:hypothetical protein